ncbi:MAG: T9SS type A sorting domain-containing protein [Crocinitomicaceae bacterium]|nr:T9SS type A sorting domain-containing protein [Crocinitomicaceae bacterium]
MKRFFSLVFLLSSFTFSWAQINVQWEARLNDPAGNFIDNAVDLALDASGNTYVTGTSYNGTSYDIVTVKYDSDGNEIWRTPFGGSGIDEANAITLDGNNDVIVTGSTFISASDYDLCVIKYNGITGAIIWSTVNAGSTLYDSGEDVTVDGSNDVVVTGSQAVSASDVNWIVQKYNGTTGASIWVQTGGGTLNDMGKVVAVDAAGFVYVAGHREFSSGTTYFDFLLLKFNAGGGAPIVNITQDSGFGKLDTPHAMKLDASGNIYIGGQGFTTVVDEEDYLLMKFNNAGTFQWLQMYAGDSEALDRINALDIDLTSGNVFVTGRSKSNASSEDYHTMAYNSAGTLLWEQSYSSAGLEFDEATDIVLGASGNLYVTGYSYRAGTNNDYTTLKYDLSGNLIWETSFDGPSSLSDQAIKMKLDPIENIFVTGKSHGGTATNLDYSTIKYCQLETVGGADEAICVGQNVNLTASGGINITWSVLSGDAGSLSCSVCATNNVDPTVTTTYVVSSESLTGCIDYDTVVVVVNAIPTPTIYADGPLSFCIGGDVVLSTDTYNAYLWSTTETSNAITVSTGGVYTVTITDANGCQNTANTTVTVNGLPNVNAGTDFTVCPGDSEPLNATGASTYLWNVDLTLSQLNIPNPNATPTGTTNYIVTGTDVNGCQDKDTVQATLYTLPSVNAGSDGQVCVGDIWPLNATGAVTYLWNSHPSLSALNIANPNATPTSQTEYFVTGTDGNGCSNIDSVTISTINLPGISAGVDKFICEGENVQIFATGGLSYVWNTDPTLSSTTISNPFASPLTTTTYTVEGTDINGCSNTDQVVVNVNSLPNVSAGADTSVCVGGSIVLQATGAVDYTWSPNASLSATNIANPTASPTGATTYFVTGEDGNGCENSAQVTVTINALPTISAGSDVAVCIGDSTQLNATGGVIYVWTFNTTLSDFVIADPWAQPTVDMTYFLTGTDANGCSNTDDVTVTVNPLPTPPTIYLDSVFIVSSYTTGNQWYVNGTPILGETNDTCNYFIVGQNGGYEVEYTDANGCSVFSDPADVIIIIDVSVEEEEDIFGLSVYPNPTTGTLNIDLKEGADQMMLVSMNGTVVMVENNLATGINTLDLSDLADGMYVLQFVKEGQVLAKRIVKQ